MFHKFPIGKYGIPNIYHHFVDFTRILIGWGGVSDCEELEESITLDDSVV